MEKYVGEVGKGKSFTVVRRSKPAFRMVPVDEWGDEGTWETVLDLTKGRDKKISAEELLGAIREYDGRQNPKISPKA